MTTWTEAELATIGATDEVDVATRRRDGTLRSDRIVWIVRQEDAVYVRSVLGATSAWYRGVQSAHAGHLAAGALSRDVVFVEVGDHAAGPAGLDDAIDAAYVTKYADRWPGPVAQINAPTARATTLRVDPA